MGKNDLFVTGGESLTIDDVITSVGEGTDTNVPSGRLTHQIHNQVVKNVSDIELLKKIAVWGEIDIVQIGTEFELIIGSRNFNRVSSSSAIRFYCGLRGYGKLFISFADSGFLEVFVNDYASATGGKRFTVVNKGQPPVPYNVTDGDFLKVTYNGTSVKLNILAVGV